MKRIDEIEMNKIEMKRINKIEDFMSGCRAINSVKDSTCFGNMTNDFIALPVDDPIRGTFGCMVLPKENNEHSLTYEKKVYEPCELHHCEDGDEFFKFLKRSLDSNYPTFICDQPKTLKVGFISLRNDSNKYYSLSLSEYKKHMDSKEKKKRKKIR